MEGLPNIPGLGDIVEKAREMGRQMNEVRERLRSETDPTGRSNTAPG